MKDTISLFEEMSNFGVGNSIKIIFLTFASIMGIWKMVEWILDKLNLYHKSASAKEELVQDIEALKVSDAKKTQSINELKAGLNEIKELFQSLKEDENKKAIAMIRPDLLNLYYKCMAQKYVTQADLETFDELAQIYLKKGGNSSFKHKIIPEFMDLPIKN